MQDFLSQWVTVISRRTVVCPLPWHGWQQHKVMVGKSWHCSGWAPPMSLLFFPACSGCSDFSQVAQQSPLTHSWIPVRPGHLFQLRQPWDVLLTASGRTKVLVGQCSPSPLPLLPTFLGNQGHCHMVVGMGTGGREEEVLLDTGTSRAVDRRWSSVCSRQALGSHVSSQFGWNGPKLNCKNYSVWKAVSSETLFFSVLMTGCLQWLQICLRLSESISLCCIPAQAAEHSAEELCEMQVVEGNRSCTSDTMLPLRCYWLKSMENLLWIHGCEWLCSAPGFHFVKKACVWNWRSAISKAGSDTVCLCLWEKWDLWKKWDNPHLEKWSLLRWSFQNYKKKKKLKTLS